MSNQLNFQSYRRSQAAKGAVVQDGRLSRHLQLTLADLNGVPQPPVSQVQFLLMGPRDVSGLKPGAVRRTYPTNGAFNVETDKCPYVEFAADDLPWRYSPDPNSPGMKPWLLLIVGTPEEVTLLPGDRVMLSQGLVDSYVGAGWSAKAHLWAHVQEHDGTVVSRLLSPRPLQPSQGYVAVIVPAFNSSGVPSLPVGAAIQSYYAWHFVTSDTPGGFRDLAMRLWPLKPIPNNLGMAPVAYQTAPSQSTLQPQMLIGGALVGLTSGSPAALPQEVQDHFAPVRPTLDPVFQHDADGRPLVRLPLYGEPWLDPGTTEPAWVKELNDAPRYRGVAGLGMWAGIEWQDRIVEAASKQLGSFYVAARRIRQLTAGLAATRSLWDRRLPADEMHRLQVLGLAMPRLATAQGGSALDHVAAADRPMPRAFFSSAARRIFRPGTARARQAQPGALTPAVLFERMNTCRSDSRDHPGGLLHTDTLCDGSLDEVIGAIEDGGHFQISGVAREGSVVLDDEERRAREEAGLGPARWFDAVSVFEEHPDVWKHLFVDAHAPYRTRPCETNGANLSRLSDILQAAFNPHGDDAFVIQRVRATIKGLDDQPLAPPELCLDLQIPAWKFLNEFAKDWFLPGLAQLQILKPDEIGQLIVDREKDPVIAATTNGCFTDAFLVGINQQALTELRWRNVPVATGCTPLRRFWEPLRPEPPVSDGEPGEDILGFHRWSSDTLLGDAQHETPEAQGDNLVLIFKSQLWRRYPETLIYLLPKKPAPNDEPDWAAAHITPNLHVEIERDVVAFGFVQSSAILETHWVVIEQVPRGFSFYNLSKPAGNQANQQLDSSQFAREAFAQAVRVLILGTELKPQP